MIRKFLLLLLMFVAVNCIAQNYQAIHGSPFAGSLGIHNNPASILMAPGKWDVTLFGIQEKSTTNMLTIYDYSYLSNPQKSKYLFDGGNFKRYGFLSANLNVLNTRIAFGKKSAIAFGANLKSYSNITSSPYNYSDTLKTTGEFFKINDPGDIYNAELNSSSWAEIYLSYSRTIIDDYRGRLNAGITVKVNKGLASGRADLVDAGFQRIGDNRYNISQGSFNYFYSSNLDPWVQESKTGRSLANFMKYTDGGISFDAGVEYIINPGELSFYDDPDNYYDYDWKIGASLLDAGFTRYRFGSQSRIVSGVLPAVTNVQLDNKFDSTINSLAQFNDSLSTIVANFSGIAGRYSMINPMRLVVNVDRYLSGHWYINADLTINAPSGWLKSWYSVREMNLITITPRWETSKLGAYLPLQVTTKGKFMVGAAFKAGPLLLGFHNLANLFGKTSVQNGGGYLALRIQNPTFHSKKQDRRLDCPTL